MVHLLLYYLFFTLPISITKSQQPAISTDPAYYYNLCAPSTCGNLSLPYPFTLPTSCHPSNLQTFCPTNQYLLLGSHGGSSILRVLSLNLTDTSVYNFVVAADDLFNCGAQISRPYYFRGNVIFSLSSKYGYGTHFNCTSSIPSNSIRGLQNASCLGCGGQDPSNVCYYAPSFESAPNCEAFHIFSPGALFNASSVTNLRAYLKLGFEIRYNKIPECRGCEVSGGRCGVNPSSGSFICFCPSSAHRMNCTDGMMEDLLTWVIEVKRGKSGPSTAVVAAISASVSVLIVGVLAALAVVYYCRWKRKRVIRKGAISSITPTRFSYSQLKKLTNNFSTKLGEGGFGSVYKGIIHRNSMEVPVAVKMLKISRQTKKQFMNEVSTIGTIHHNNLVAMLGYCVEGDKYALMYEYMENGSLDEHIYSLMNRKSSNVAESNTTHRRLSSKQVYNIALETARGILYLHKGCNKKILHCDIKPPNVLLDSNFSAKVSDFGLAKMIDKDHSHVSLTMAQGTPGYAAPEMWLKSHGPVTEKSDVYSYGMLLLDMVGRRNKNEIGVSASSQACFPEWLYNKIERDEFPLLMRNGDGNDSFEIIKDGENQTEEDQKAIQRMCLVGLWCIQHIPSKRPSMNTVLKMLEGNAEIGIPPDPFLQNTTKIH